MPEWAVTLIAQVVNVAILLFLLRHFLYKPVRNMLAKRRERVEQDLDHASTAREEAEKRRKEYEEKLAGAEEEARNVVAEAENRAKEKQNRAVEEAKEAAERERRRALDDLEREKREALAAVRHRELEVAVGLARKLVEDASGPALASGLAGEIAESVRELDEEKLPVAPAGGKDDAGGKPLQAVLRTSHDPGDETVESIRKALADRLKRDVRLDVENAPALICGAELECSSLLIRSHLAVRLDEAKEALQEMLKTKSPEDVLDAGKEEDAAS